ARPPTGDVRPALQPAPHAPPAPRPGGARRRLRDAGLPAGSRPRLVARGLTAPVDRDPAAVLRPRAMGDAISRAVLITGCSSGIGRATAVQLAEHGWPVYATARRLDAIRDLAGHGCKVLALDVCDRSEERRVGEGCGG